MDIKSQAQFYDERWDDFAYVRNTKLKRTIVILQEIAKIRFKQPPHIIELGSGSGWFTNILSMIGPSTGVDLSPLAVENAKKKFPHVEFIAADISSWSGFKSGEFDLVISHEVIEHLENHKAHTTLARNLLKKGGYFILTTPNAFVTDPSEYEELQPIENWLTVRMFRNIVKKDFIIKSLLTISPGSGKKNIAKIFNNRLFRAVLRKLHLLFIYDFFLKSIGYGSKILFVGQAK